MSNQIFPPGSKVRCIKSVFGWYTVGDILTVEKTDVPGYLFMTKINGQTYRFTLKNFELIETPCPWPEWL